MLLLYYSGSGGWAFDSPGPVTHSQRLTEQRPHWTGEPPTPAIFMAHVESLKQYSVVRIDTTINFRYKIIMRAMYKMSTPCWAVINNCHWFWKIALFLLATIHIAIFYWLSCNSTHPYRWVQRWVVSNCHYCLNKNNDDHWMGQYPWWSL